MGRGARHLKRPKRSQISFRTGNTTLSNTSIAIDDGDTCTVADSCHSLHTNLQTYKLNVMEVEPSTSTAGEEPPAATGPSSTTTTTTTTQLELPAPPRASVLQHTPDLHQKLYWDRSHYSSPAAQRQALTKSATLYVGNLAFSTRQVHLRRHFEQLGPVKGIILGLDRMKKTPCGFCFVEYWNRSHALQSVALLSGTKLDGRVIRVELDAGFQPGRQYGRGVSGGQVRDDRRKQGQQSGHKRSHYEPAPPPPPVTMDGALPSARSEAATTATSMDEDAPPAKRRRM